MAPWGAAGELQEVTAAFEQRVRLRSYGLGWLIKGSGSRGRPMTVRISCLSFLPQVITILRKLPSL